MTPQAATPEALTLARTGVASCEGCGRALNCGYFTTMFIRIFG